MSDPSHPPVRHIPDAVRHPATLSWHERGGMRGFFGGQQSLALAFWVLGVGVALVLTLAGIAIEKALPRDAFLNILVVTTLVSIATRIIAWYAIIKCRRNTRSEVFTALALTAVALDIVMGVFKWPGLLFALSMV